MKARTVLVLALVVAALGAFLWFVERDLPSSEERTELSRRLLPVESAAISAVTLEWDGRQVRLERAAGGRAEDAESASATGEETWRLAAPEALAGAAADRIEVGRLLSVLAGLETQRELDEVEEAAVGLDAPRGRVIVESAGATYTVEVGADVPAAETVVVARSQNGERRVFVTGRSFVADLERAPGDWRSKEIVSASRDAVERLELISAEGPGVVLERREGRFYLSAPSTDVSDAADAAHAADPAAGDVTEVTDLAAGEEVEALLSDLVSLRVQRFVDDVAAAGGEAALGLAPPRATVAAALEDGGAVRIELGGPVPGGGGAIYGRADGQVFEAVTQLAERAARPADEWRSRAWTELRSFEIQRVEIRAAGGEPLRLERDGGDWQRDGGAVSYTEVSDLLFAITDARAAEIPGGDGGGAAVGEPILTVILAAEGGGEEVLTLYPAADGGHPARSSARASGVVLPAEAVEEIEEAVAALRGVPPPE